MATSVPRFEGKEYWTSRDFKTSARLHLQHWIYQSQLGYLIHPTIPSSLQKQENLKIADVGCGNGAWLLELSRQLPSSAQFQGFDITSSNFPAPEWLPENVRLTGGFDCLVEGAVSEEFQQQFDVVHIRLFVSNIKENKVAPLIDTLIRLLKPGGYLIWEEADHNTNSAFAPNPETSKQATEQLIKLMEMAGKNFSKLWTDWLQNLPDTLSEEPFSLEVLAHEKFTWRKDLLKPWTENLLTVYEELAVLIPPAADSAPGTPFTRESYQELYEKVVEETGKGVAIAPEGVIVIAKRNN